MASINLGWFSDNWFFRPQNPSNVPAFAFLGARSLRASKPSSSKASEPPSSSNAREPSRADRLIEQYFWEVENRPDYRYAPQVDRILNEDSKDPFFDPKPDATPEEVEENRKWWEEFRSSPVVQFLRKCDAIETGFYQEDLAKNKYPYRREDRDLWKKLPLVPGPDGRPMPRKSIRTKMEARDKFWDWARQFFFGLWGFRQRHYPPGRPIDVAQSIGYKRLERRYYDFAMRSGGWYYKDRLGRTRGPLELITLKTAWAAGIIDTHTFIWGDDLDEWAPIGMIYGMEKAIATWEVRLGAAATALVHKLQKGISPWTPLKGFEKKTYKELQAEALESKRRDMAVLEANNGVWPGVKIPSHALYLWAGGSELTTLLEEDHMPNKYIPKHLRYRLAELIPGLRPWEVINIEQAMDRITYRKRWYREPLGSYRTGPPFIRHWNTEIKLELDMFVRTGYRACWIVMNELPMLGPLFERGLFDLTGEMQQRLQRRFQRAERNSRCLPPVSQTRPPEQFPIDDEPEPPAKE